MSFVFELRDTSFERLPESGAASQTSAINSLGSSRDKRYGVPYLVYSVISIIAIVHILWTSTYESSTVPKIYKYRFSIFDYC